MTKEAPASAGAKSGVVEPRWRPVLRSCRTSAESAARWIGLTLGHRTTLLLLCGYLALMQKVFRYGPYATPSTAPEAAPAGVAGRAWSGSDLLDPLSGPPLVRSGASSQSSGAERAIGAEAKPKSLSAASSASSGSLLRPAALVVEPGGGIRDSPSSAAAAPTRKRQRVKLRRQVLALDSTGSGDWVEDDGLSTLAAVEAFVATPRGDAEPEPAPELSRAQRMLDVHVATAKVQSALGRYAEAMKAMSQAVQAAKATGSDEALAFAFAEFGLLELQHFQFDRAERRFRDSTGAGAFLQNASLGPLSATSGWSAAMVEGDADRSNGAAAGASRELTAEGRLAEALEQIGPASADGGGGCTRLGGPSPAGCRPRHDGLDDSRALALAGLCLLRARRGAEGDRGAPLCECAGNLLGSGVAGGAAPSLSTAAVRRALGLARQALGQGDRALYEQRRAHSEEQRLAPSASSCVLRLSRLGGSTPPEKQQLTGFTQCAQSALHLGFAELSSGNQSLGISYVTWLAARVAAATSGGATGSSTGDVPLWFAGFARSLGRGVLASTAASPAALPSATFATILMGEAAAAATTAAARDSLASVATPSATALRTLLLPPKASRSAGARESLLRRLAASALQKLLDLRYSSRDNLGGVAQNDEDAALYRLLAELYDTIGEQGLRLRAVAAAIEVAGPDQLERRTVGVQEATAFIEAYVQLAEERLRDAQAATALRLHDRWRQGLRAAVALFRGARQCAKRFWKVASRRFSASGDAAAALRGLQNSLERKFWETLRLAHRRGAFDSCPGPRDALLFGLTCASASADDDGQAS